MLVLFFGGGFGSFFFPEGGGGMVVILFLFLRCFITKGGGVQYIVLYNITKVSWLASKLRVTLDTGKSSNQDYKMSTH